MTHFKAEFTETETIEIAKEFQRIGDNVYLDHAGTTLYSETQIDAASKILKENLFCNPHTCKITGDLVDQVRYRILRHFNTDATEYAVVFTGSATMALKLVAETFHFGPTNHKDHNTSVGGFYYCQENHTSILGMRDVVNTDCLFVLTKDEILKNLSHKHESNSTVDHSTNSLLAFSAQCNFSGYKMPLQLIEPIQRNGLIDRGKQIRGADNLSDETNFYICLDTASYVATNYLDLQAYKPDFCCISFYKMFGFPTGVGALLVSKRGQNVLHKKYYGGGTVKISMTRQDFHEKRDAFTDRFEDGTLPFLSIVSLLQGFRTMERLVPATPTKLPVQRIAMHVFALAKYCHDSLAKLCHANGSPLIKFYNHCGYESIEQQGGIVTFNILHDDGSYVGFAEVICIASVHNVILRTGCFCNPGACQWHLQLSDGELRKHFESGHICSDYNDLVDGVPTGAVRMSFGYMTQLQNVQDAITMIRNCYLTTAEQRLKIIDECTKLPKALQHIPQRLRSHVRKICIYPIKSCSAFEIHGEWRVTNSGFKYDRNWMIVDANGMVITQKHHTRLCLIKPLIHINEGLLEMTFPGIQSVSIPLDLTNEAMKRVESSMCHSKVCNDLVEGLDCGDEVAQWLSDCMEVDGIRLLRQNAERRTRDGISKDMSLANQAQFLLLNRTSVRWLADKVASEKEPLDHTVDRFRANLIIETTNPLEENDFEEITLSGIKFRVDGFCTRCQMICIDQRTGQKTSEPLRTIAREFNGKIRFGIYLSIVDIPKEDVIISCKDVLHVRRYNSTL